MSSVPQYWSEKRKVMSIELIDGEDLLLVRGMDAVTAMATDGYYIPIEKYSEAMDVPLATVKTWKKRKTIEAITLFGRSYVKKGCEPDSHSFKKYIKK